MGWVTPGVLLGPLGGWEGSCLVEGPTEGVACRGDEFIVNTIFPSHPCFVSIQGVAHATVTQIR